MSATRPPADASASCSTEDAAAETGFNGFDRQPGPDAPDAPLPAAPLDTPLAEPAAEPLGLAVPLAEPLGLAPPLPDGAPMDNPVGEVVPLDATLPLGPVMLPLTEPDNAPLEE